jgi:hypothetical protein
MCVVATRTHTAGHRLVNRFPFEFRFIMATVTQVRHALCQDDTPLLRWMVFPLNLFVAGYAAQSKRRMNAFIFLFEFRMTADAWVFLSGNRLRKRF